MSGGEPVSAPRFAAFRIAFGAYLAVWMGWLVPWAAELFGDGGLPGLPGAPASRLPLPAPLTGSLPDLAAPWLVAAMAALGVLVAAGVARRSAALLFWLGLVWLYDRNPALHNPSLAYVGWLCLALVLVPRGEPGSLGPADRRADRWHFPPGLFAGAWWILALAYTVSGLDKLGSDAWRDGDALRLALDLPWARPGLARDVVLSLPDGVLRLVTWAGLASELLFAPLAAFRLTRPWIWLAALGLHLGLLATMAFPQLSLGLVLAHAFTFDERWIRRGPYTGR